MRQVGPGPNAVGVLLRALLALCAAGAGFVFDEPASALVVVAPRGAGWRRTNAASVALLPVVVWFLVLLVAGQRRPDRAAWRLVGAACVLLATAAAGLASRAQVTAPGASIAAVLALGLLQPHLMSPVPRLGPAARGDPSPPPRSRSGWP